MHRTARILASALIGVLASGVVALPASTAPPSGPATPTPVAFTHCYLQCVSPALLHTTTPTFLTSLSGPAGTRQEVEFEVHTAPSDRSPLVASGRSTLTHVPYSAQWRIADGLLADAGTYYWRAQSYDEAGRHSKWTAWQSLSVDTGNPEAPTVSSAEYPEREWGAPLGTPTVFALSTASVDAHSFLWDLNYDNVTTTPATGAGPRTAAVGMTPPKDGVNTLNVFVLDAAGNRSETVHYYFYVTPPPLRYAHWTLDETEGGTAADSGTHDVTATLSGDAVFAPGYVNGSGGVQVGGQGRISAPGVLDPAQSFTVMAWVNASRLDGRHTVFSQHAADGSGFALYADSTANGGAGAWCATLTGSAGSDTACTAYALPAVGQWTHVAALRDAITGRLAVYVGGGDTCYGETAQITAPALGPAAGDFLIGGSAGGEGWDGLIDDVWAHRRAVSDTTICQQASW